MVFEKQEAMSSREKILARVKSNQPLASAAPTDLSPVFDFDPLVKFKDILISTGGSVIEVLSEDEVLRNLPQFIPLPDHAIIIGPDAESTSGHTSPHSFHNVDAAVLRAEFAVAENGAVWITDKSMIDRALPFICSYLALIVKKESIVPTMHHAYEQIGASAYGLGTFIAGPSKTADIEQSLVLGAHGAKTLTCFLVG